MDTVTIKCRPGSWVRVWGDYIWNEANGFVCEVAAEDVPALLASPRGEFSRADEGTQGEIDGTED